METSHTNPLMAKIKLPGRTFQLPSRGALYKDGEISTQEGEVHVHALSALAEINLKNPDMLFNGKALEEVFAECIPEIRKPTQLFGRDIDALMFFLRLVTYGPQYEITVTHTCENAKKHSYVVDIEKLLAEIKFLDVTQAEQFKVTLPNDQVVVLHPVRFEHMIKLFHMNTGKETLTVEDMKKNIVFNLVNLIDSVDGISDRKNIEEWVRGISSPYQNRIAEVIEKMNHWGPPNNTKVTCKDCGEEFEIELPLNPISFFTE